MAAMVNGAEREVFEGSLTDKELKALKMLRKMIIDARMNRATGESNLIIDWYNGGVTKAYVLRKYLVDFKE